MFEIKRYCCKSGNYYIVDENSNCLHSDGSTYFASREYFPTQEDAQAILDKFQPKHMWEHGDVFRCDKELMIYIAPKFRKPRVDYLVINLAVNSKPEVYLNYADTEFLFNIGDKL